VNINRSVALRGGFAEIEGKKMLTHHMRGVSEGQKNPRGSLAREDSYRNSLSVWHEDKMANNIAWVNLKRASEPRWCSSGLSNTQRRRL
jgi:hypothetical protein